MKNIVLENLENYKLQNFTNWLSSAKSYYPIIEIKYINKTERGLHAKTEIRV